MIGLREKIGNLISGGALARSEDLRSRWHSTWAACDAERKSHRDAIERIAMLAKSGANPSAAKSAILDIAMQQLKGE